jgi:hypothetical protein
MSKRDFRIIDSDGKPIPFTCENTRFMTDTSKSPAGGPGPVAPGSVFAEPLAGIPGKENSLWLERVVEKTDNSASYWLMWYNRSGEPLTPVSGVFSKAAVTQMAKRLASFVQ